MSYEPPRRPFITGSRAYGKPHEESDTDLVVRVDGHVAAVLEALAGRYACDYDHESISVRFGDLNLHLCTTDKEYDRWAKGTEACMVVAPIEREKACKMLRVHGVDRGAERDVGKCQHYRGPGKVDALRDDGTITPYRIWMGYEKPEGDGDQ